MALAVAASLFRVGIVASTLLHETSHVLSGVVAQKHKLSASLTRANLMGKTPKKSVPLMTADVLHVQALAHVLNNAPVFALHAYTDRGLIPSQLEFGRFVYKVVQL